MMEKPRNCAIKSFWNQATEMVHPGPNMSLALTFLLSIQLLPETANVKEKPYTKPAVVFFPIHGGGAVFPTQWKRDSYSVVNLAYS